MPSANTKPTIQVVRSCAALRNALSRLHDASTIYLDFEGRRVSRYGSISIIIIHAPVFKPVYLIDVDSLGREAFETEGCRNITLKLILEDPKFTKTFFDVRNDADALQKHYGVALQGVCGIQLIELAARTGSRKYVNELEKCISSDPKLSTKHKYEWPLRKELIKAAECVRLGDRDFEAYCAGQGVFLPGLFKHFVGQLDPYWLLKVDHATEERIWMVQSPHYDPESADKLLGPWPNEESSQDYLNSDEYWDATFDVILPDDDVEDGLTEMLNDLDCEDGDEDEDEWADDYFGQIVLAGKKT